MRRLAFWGGLALVVAGLVLLGYVGWQFYGTNWVSHRMQQQEIESFHKPQGEPADIEVDPVSNGRVFALIRIPRFGKDYEMPVLQGTSDDVLSSGFGHFAASAAPGEKGNFALAAHRVTHGEPLRDMPDLRPGDEVIVRTHRGTYLYVIDTDPNQLVVPFDASWVLDPFPRNPGDGPTPDPADGRVLITLTTCSEIFHTDNRMIAFGHLVKAEVLTGS